MFNKDLSIHPYADCYPMISGDAWLDFVQSISASNGPVQPLIIWKDEDRDKLWLVDGRNRFKACQDLSINLDDNHVRYMQFNNDEEVRSFIIQVNNDRRQMSKQQRTAVALDMMEVQKELGRKIQKEKGRTHGQPLLLNLAKGSSHDSRKIVAQELGVNRNEIMQAKIIQDKGAKETFEAYKQGIASTNALKLITELSEEEQIEVVNEGAKAIKQKASEIRAKKKQSDQALPTIKRPLIAAGIVRGLKPCNMRFTYLTTVQGQLTQITVDVPNDEVESFLELLRTLDWFEEVDES
tara:strand:+ start:2232 stop:3116 length:885 start_codon:yes stop_codon:yes gene_type:complete